MKKRGIVAVIVLLLIALDQWVKAYVLQQIPLGEVRSWIPNLFINFAIFNVADSYLTVGVIVLLIAMLKEEVNGNKN